MLLQKDNEFIIYNLVLRNLIGRDYYPSDCIPEENDSSTAENKDSPINGKEDWFVEYFAKLINL